MALQLFTPQNGDKNLAAGATVLSITPDASNPRLCYAFIKMGDGSKNLNGTGGNFTITVTIDGNSWNGGGETQVVGTAVRTALQTEAFFVPANAAVTIAVTSPNAADTDVDCTAYLVSETNPTTAEIADAVLDELMSGHTTPGSLGATIIQVGTNYTWTNTASGTGYDRVTVTKTA